MGSRKARARFARALDWERAIAEALGDVAAEIRLTDVAELIDLIRNDQAANLADLIHSSTELFFKSGTLRYALSADFAAAWEAAPEVALDMEFRHAAVSAFFRLTLGRRRMAVEVLDVLFDEMDLDDEAKSGRLAAALASARLAPASPRR